MNILQLLKPKATIEYLFSDSTARQALEKMKHHGFTAVPVIDRDGKFVKTLAEGELVHINVDDEACGTDNQACGYEACVCVLDDRGSDPFVYGPELCAGH